MIFNKVGVIRSYIIEAMETDQPFKIGGNVLNTGGLISNLPENAVVEVPCLVDASGIDSTPPIVPAVLRHMLAQYHLHQLNMELLLRHFQGDC